MKQALIVCDDLRQLHAVEMKPGETPDDTFNRWHNDGRQGIDRGACDYRGVTLRRGVVFGQLQAGLDTECGELVDSAEAAVTRLRLTTRLLASPDA